MKRLRRLLKYLAAYKSLVLGNILSNVLMALFTVISIPAIIPFLQILFDQSAPVATRPTVTNLGSFVDFCKFQISELIRTDGKETALIYICIFLVVLYFMRNLFRYLSMFFMAPVRNGLVRDIRNQLFDKLMHLPLSYFSEKRKGDLMARITTDVGEIEWSIFNVLETVFREPIILIGCLSYMLYVSPVLTGFVFLLLLVAGSIIGRIGKRLKKQSHKAQDQLGTLVSIIEEGISGLRIVKGFNAEGYQSNKFGTVNDTYKDILTRVLWRRDLASPLSEFLGIILVAVLLWFASKQVFAGKLDPATFFSYLLAFYYILNPVKNFSSALYNIQKGMAAVERVEVILNEEDRIVELENARSIEHFKNEIEYRSIGFHYQQSEQEVLKNINLKIPKGKIIALVGASGAGKSTLADLLPRFYDVVSGEIILDGLNIKEYKLKDLRNLIGIVSQEAILFNDTIFNNIVFGKKGIDKNKVIECAKIANAHDFIMQTEKGYESNIGDRGMKLSGGQRQRLTLARALVNDPPILILDEATSALDSESELLVQQALLNVMQNRTSIVIAHRLSTIQNADEIIVLDQGEIIERGNHSVLLEKNGIYRKLFELQAF